MARTKKTQTTKTPSTTLHKTNTAANTQFANDLKKQHLAAAKKDNA